MEPLDPNERAAAPSPRQAPDGTALHRFESVLKTRRGVVALLRLHDLADMVPRPTLQFFDRRRQRLPKKARQAGLDERTAANKQARGSTDPTLPFWSKRRPRYLFSGLMRCGVCGGGFSKISEAHFGCSTARNKGETVCANRLTIRRDALEATVMDGLRSRLMEPALFKVFADEFAAEWNRLQARRPGQSSTVCAARSSTV
jgi:hypothetical protein